LFLTAAISGGLTAQASPAAAAGPEEGFVALFNGRDMTGWEGDTHLWTVRDGMLVGKSAGLKYNDFLSTTSSYEDFVLKLSFRLVNGEGNSGVQFRSQRVPDSHEVSGFQADIGPCPGRNQQCWGNLYDEARRKVTLVDAQKAGADKVVKKQGWNDLEIWCQGNHIVLKLNGLTTADYRENDPTIARSGIFALQMHAGVPMEIQFKNIRIKKLPE
jgi:hypothetical protein